MSSPEPAGRSRPLRMAGLALLGIAVGALLVGLITLGDQRGNGGNGDGGGTAAPATTTADTATASPGATTPGGPGPTGGTGATDSPATPTAAPTTTPPAPQPTTASQPTTAAPPPPPPPAMAPVRVYNNSLRSGLAAEAAQDFRDDGWEVLEVGNYSSGVIPTSTVYYRPGTSEEAAARRLGQRFNLRVEPRFEGITQSSPGLIVIVTSDYGSK